jgi:hypothetical protein
MNLFKLKVLSLLFMCSGLFSYAFSNPVSSSGSPSSYDVEYRLRHGGSGWEAGLFTPNNPGPVGVTLDAQGAPAWSFGLDYSFEFSHTKSNGKSVLKVDFNRDGDFDDANESTTSTSSGLAGKAFTYLNVSVVGSSNGDQVSVTDLLINGVNVGGFSANSNASSSQLYEESNGFFGDLVVTGTINFSGGQQQERPKFWISLADFVQVGTITTRVWDDRNGNGKQDEGHFIQAAQVNLLSKSNVQLATSYTDASGNASFSVAPGQYKLEFVAPADHEYTLQNKSGVSDNQDSDANRNNGRTGTFSVAANQNVTNVDAGFWAPGTATARVWDDRNGNGKQDEGHFIAGATVHLLESNNMPVINPNTGDTVRGVTDANGNAVLNYVPADRSVKFQFDMLADHDYTLQNKAGVSDNQDSDANRNNGRTASFKADRGSQSTTKFDAGFWAPGTVTARVWEDKNGNGKQEYQTGI